MTLGEKQRKFTWMVGLLINFAYANGYEMTFGDAQRSKQEAERLGFPNSNHTRRLAVDLNLFKGGVYLDKTEDHLPLGEFWESMGGAWGGRFSKPDGNHYSLEYNGVK